MCPDKSGFSLGLSARQLFHAATPWFKIATCSFLAIFSTLASPRHHHDVQIETFALTTPVISYSMRIRGLILTIFFIPIPFTLIKSRTSSNGLSATIRCAITRPTPGRDSNSAVVAVLMLINVTDFDVAGAGDTAEPVGSLIFPQEATGTVVDVLEASSSGLSVWLVSRIRG